MPADAQFVSMVRSDLVDVLCGAFFVFVGVVAFVVAAIRRRLGVRTLVWTGCWSAIFGCNMLAQSNLVVIALPAAARPVLNLISVASSYLTLVAAALAFLELTSGALRRLLQFLLLADIAIAVAGIGTFLSTGNARTWILPNQFMAVVGLVGLLVTLAVPKFKRQYLVLSHSRVLLVGTFLFAAEALWTNVARPLNVRTPAILDSLGFAVLLFGFGYAALEIILRNEHRLVSLDRELEIARALQISILPEGVPAIRGLEIAAKYVPMTAVAGDFYEFVEVDAHRAGFLVADVSGHGVPAALIASMIKMATKSARAVADDPAEVLRRLDAALGSELKGQFVSAAYLWIDTERRIARYSAAGHPPLLRWCEGCRELGRVESNGLLMGVMSGSSYPACEFPLAAGDRLLLYTDGLTEAENFHREQFGDMALEGFLKYHARSSAEELSNRLVAEVGAWQATDAAQDDLTLIVINVQANAAY